MAAVAVHADLCNGYCKVIAAVYAWAAVHCPSTAQTDLYRPETAWQVLCDTGQSQSQVCTTQNSVTLMITIGRVRLGNDKERFGVVVFPEGTRGNGTDLLPFKLSAFHMAVSTGVPIVPVVIGSHLKYAGKSTFPISILGESFAVHGLNYFLSNFFFLLPLRPDCHRKRDWTREDHGKGKRVV